MQAHRNGEDGAIPQRSSRFVTQDDAWFFNIREGAQIGPFASKRQAESGLTDFLDFIALAKPEVLSAFLESLDTSSTAN